MRLDEQELGSLGVAIHNGFPNAAIGSHQKSLSLDKLLVRHPTSTYFLRLESNNWSSYGMFPGDIVVVDRSLHPRPQDMVVWCRESDFTMSKLKDVDLDRSIWGTVSSVIHRLKS